MLYLDAILERGVKRLAINRHKAYEKRSDMNDEDDDILWNDVPFH